MSSGAVRLVLLCEDDAHVSFILGRFPIPVRFIRIEKMGGNAKVISQYPREAKEVRRKRYQKNLGLLVVIDGDDKGYEARKRELDRALVESGMSPRGVDDPIAIVVPSRNIETWIVGFLGELAAVDEQKDYKGDPICREKDAARRAGELFGAPMSAESARLPALADARVELRRLPTRS